MSEVQNLMDAEAEKAKKYKSPVDVERVNALAEATMNLRNHPNLNAIIGSINRELVAINATQEDLDKKEREDYEKKLAEAKAKDAKAAQAEAKKEEEAAEAGHASAKKGSK